MGEAIEKIDECLLLLEFSAPSIPELGKGCKICSLPTGLSQESLVMLQKSADCGDKHATFDLAAVHNLELVPEANHSKAVMLLKNLAS